MSLCLLLGAEPGALRESEYRYQVSSKTQDPSFLWTQTGKNGALLSKARVQREPRQQTSAEAEDLIYAKKKKTVLARHKRLIPTGIQEAEEGQSINLKLIWDTQEVLGWPGTQRKTPSLNIKKSKLSMVGYTFNPSTWEAEACRSL